MNLAIKLPNDLKDRILSFPFLHVLIKELKKQQKELEEESELNIHLICDKEGIDILNLLPFDAFYHEIEKEDQKTVFSMHRAAGNLKFPNGVDTFISTTDSFIDASIGKTLKAKNKIGFGLGKTAFFLNKKVPFLNGRHKSEQIFQLMRGVVEGEISQIPNSVSRNLEPYLSDWNDKPYTVINLSLKNGAIFDEWKHFLELFQEKRFVLMCSDVDEKNEYLIDDFIKELAPVNEYIPFKSKSHIDFGKLISYCTCFITKNSYLMHLASYCGSHCFYLNQSEQMSITGPEFFIGQVRNFALSDPTMREGNDFNYGRIFDEIFEFIDNKTKVD